MQHFAFEFSYFTMEKTRKKKFTQKKRGGGGVNKKKFISFHIHERGEDKKDKKKTDTAHQNNKDHKLQVRSKIQSIINKKE